MTYNAMIFGQGLAQALFKVSAAFEQAKSFVFMRIVGNK